MYRLCGFWRQLTNARQLRTVPWGFADPRHQGYGARNESQQLLFFVLLYRALGPGRECALKAADANSPPEAERGFGFFYS